MEENKILITTQYVREKFKEHICAPNNYRLLFSGKYGSGKTYFLQEYFDINKDKYETFHLFPTNYAVSSNEDIVKLLQFDIMYEIIRKGILEPSEKFFSNKDIIAPFLRNHASGIIRDVVSHCSSIGKKLADIYDNSQKWLDKFESFKQQMNETESDKARAAFEKLLKEVEYCEYTELIELALSNIENKQKVLIVDDLDRIDPEHIFRLLNVFSAQLSDYFPAHASASQNENRFGFDKVIFVCDIDNIRNIYHAKYGEKTDFLGYIDKFYSIGPFYYDNNNQIAHEAHQFVRSIRSEYTEEDCGMLTALTRMLLFHNVIRLRQLVEKSFANWESTEWKYPNLISDINYSSVRLIDYLIFIFGSKDDLINTLKGHNEEVNIDVLKKSDFRLVDLLLPLLQDIRDLPLNAQIEYRNNELNTTISFSCQKKYRDKYTIIDYDNIKDRKGNRMDTIPYFGLLRTAVERFCEMNEARKVLRY